MSEINLRDKDVSIEIRKDKKVLWVNTEDGCVLRISNIRSLAIEQR